MSKSDAEQAEPESSPRYYRIRRCGFMFHQLIRARTDLNAASVSFHFLRRNATRSGKKWVRTGHVPRDSVVVQDWNQDGTDE